MMLLDGEVTRTFFRDVRFVLGKCVWYKSCSSDFALSNKKKIRWCRSRQDSPTFVPRILHRILLIFIISFKFSSSFLVFREK
jgi:hypothetical protein